MDHFFSGNRVSNITNGRIENISSGGSTTYVTVSYNDCRNCARNSQTIVLIVGTTSKVFNEKGTQIPPSFLRIGMWIDASYSSSMTRSIPPQAAAYTIRIVNSDITRDTATGTIFSVDPAKRCFSTLSNGNPMSVIQFHLADNSRIFDRFGRPANFSSLRPGMRVRVRHANFMTASLPPQTTAFEVQLL